MQAAMVGSAPSRVPIWFRLAAVLGVLWNAYGVYQFAGSFTQTLDSLMATGMTQAQAQVYLALPAWIGVVFAVGVSGGLIGSLAMAARRSVAVPIFATSLVAYVMLFAGDAYHGVFASIPSQLAILAVVVLIAAALLGAARLAQRRGLLR